MKRRIKRMIAFILAFVLILNIVVNQSYFLDVFAQSKENIQDVILKGNNEAGESSEDGSSEEETGTTQNTDETTTQSSSEETSQSEEDKTTQSSTGETTQTKEETSSSATNITEGTTKSTETITGGTTSSSQEETKTTKPEKETSNEQTKKKSTTSDTNKKSAPLNSTLDEDNTDSNGEEPSDNEDDKTPEVVALIENADYSVDDAARTIIFKTSSAHGFNQYKIDESDWKDIDASGSETVTLESDGKYTIEMRCVEKNSDNGTEKEIRVSEEKTIVIDTTAPIIKTIEVDKSWKNSDYELDIPVSDDVSGVKAVKWERWKKGNDGAPEGEHAEESGSISGIASRTGTKFILKAENIKQGEYLYIFYAEDNFGNTTSDGVTVTIRKDTYKLETEISVQDTKPTEGPEIDKSKWYGSAANFTVTVKTPEGQENPNPSGIKSVIAKYEENGADKEVRLTGESGVYSLKPAAGDHTYTIQAISGSGEKGKETIVRIKYDKEAPSANVLAKYYLVDGQEETEITEKTSVLEDAQVKVRLYVQDDLSGMGKSIQASYQAPVEDETTGGEETTGQDETTDEGTGAGETTGGETTGNQSSTKTITFTNNRVVTISEATGAGTEKAAANQYYEFEADETIPGAVFATTQQPLTIKELADMAGNLQNQTIIIIGFTGKVEEVKDTIAPEFSVDALGEGILYEDGTIYTKDSFTPAFHIVEVDSYIADGVTYQVKENGQDNIDLSKVAADESGASKYMFTGESLDGAVGEETAYDLSFAYKDGSGNSMVLSENSDYLPYGKLSNGTFTTKVVVDKKAPVIGNVTVGNYNEALSAEQGSYYALFDKNNNKSFISLEFSIEETNLKNSSTKVIATSTTGNDTVEIPLGESNDDGKLTSDGQNPENCTFEFYKEGNWNFTIYAEDEVGNTSNQTVKSGENDATFIINNFVPTITVTYDSDSYDGENIIYTNKGKSGTDTNPATVTITIKDEGGLSSNEEIIWKGNPVQLSTSSGANGTEYTAVYQMPKEGDYQITRISYTGKNGAEPQNVIEEFATKGDKTVVFGDYNNTGSTLMKVDHTDPVISDVNVDAGKNIFYEKKLYLNQDGTMSKLSFGVTDSNLDTNSIQAGIRINDNETIALTSSSQETSPSYVYDFGIQSWGDKAEENNGNYHLEVNAKDKAGNVADTGYVEKVNDTAINSKEKFIVYDVTKPVLTIQYPSVNNILPFGESEKEIFYQSVPDIKISLNEANYVGKTMKDTGVCENFTPALSTNANDMEAPAKVNFAFTQQAGGGWTASLPLPEGDSHNRFSLSYTDLSGNVAEIKESTADGQVYGTFRDDSTLISYTYDSPEITVDVTDPRIEVQFSGTEDSNSYQNRTGDTGRTYYSSNVTMTITVTEENFDSKDFQFSGNIRKYNEAGDEKLNPETWIEDNYYNNDEFQVEDSDENKVDNIHQFVIKLTDEWNYNLEFNYTDQSGRSADEQSHKISVDKTKPTIEVKNIENLTESDMEFFNGAIGNNMLDFYDYIRYGYFGKNKVAVRIEAHDDTSGIQYVEVRINGQTAVHELKDGSSNGAIKDVVHDKKSTWYTVIFLDADFKGTIEARPVDKAGNMQSQFAIPRGVVSETQSKHDASSTLKITTLTKPSNTVGGINYYNRNVSVNLLMEDEHSGIKSYSYTAGEAISGSQNYGREAGTVDKKGDPSVDNVFKKEFTPVLTTAANYTNKENPTMVEAEFTDNAGYTEKVNEKYVIDDKKPEIEVTWTSEAEVMNEKYYRSTRVAHIKVIERNFDEDGVKWDINNRTGVHISDWNHNGDVNTCRISFTEDGDFLMNFSITDYAKNTSNWKGEEFTIDKTAPVISISFDNMDAQNGNYFNRARTATLHVEEHNFRAEDVKYELSATNDGQGIASPTAGGWSMGSDHHTASIYYGTDGNFSLNFNYTDMAGNPANVIATEEFVIDLTKPTVKIVNVEDYNAYNEEVAPGVEYSDTNLDENEVTIRLVGNKVGNADYERNAPANIHNGRIIEWKDFERISEVDDIYTLEVTVKDKAGNVNDPAKVTFSVNRFGSNYIFGTQTEELLSKEYPYTNQEIPIEVTEINVSALKEKAVSVRNEDNDIVNLAENENYTVTEGLDEYKWKEYKYVINSENFEEEGEYTVTLFSEDEATNQMDNVTKDKDIEFVIDKTAPTGTISGLEKNSYREDEHEITVRAGDNYGLEKAVLYIDNEEKGEYSADDFAGDNGVPVTLTSKNTPQNVSMELFDLAGNTTRIGHGENDRGCLITSNAWIQFYNNKPLFISVMGVGAVGILAVIGVLTHGFGFAASMAAESGFWWFLFGKRKKDEDEGNDWK